MARQPDPYTYHIRRLHTSIALDIIRLSGDELPDRKDIELAIGHVSEEQQPGSVAAVNEINLKGRDIWQLVAFSVTLDVKVSRDDLFQHLYTSLKNAAAYTGITRMRTKLAVGRTWRWIEQPDGFDYTGTMPPILKLQPERITLVDGGPPKSSPPDVV